MVYRESGKNIKVDPGCPTDFLQIYNMAQHMEAAITKWNKEQTDENFLDLVDAAKDLGVAWVNLSHYVEGGKEFLKIGHTLALLGIQDEHRGRFAKSQIERLDQKLGFTELFLYRAKHWAKNNSCYEILTLDEPEILP